MEGSAELYDDFGNYIGPDLDGDEGDQSPRRPEWDDDEGERQDSGDELEGDDGGATAAAGAGRGAGGRGTAIIPHGVMSMESAVVLHEDKKYYPTAEEVYPEAETLVQDEDTQPLSQPIIAPIKAKQFSVLEKEIPETTYPTQFLTSLMSCPALIRNVAVAGQLHHGKTTLLDRLIEATHTSHASASSSVSASSSYAGEGSRRYTDSRKDEQERGMSIKMTPVSLVLPSLARGQRGEEGKSHLLTLIDTPGHTNFSDEQTAAFRAADGVLLVVDAVEGMMMGTERTIRAAVGERLPIVLCVNKVDRLVLELKLPPQDAYFKLAAVISEVNAVIASACSALPPSSSSSALAPLYPELDPALGNVVFSSATHGWFFSLESFAKRYSDRQSSGGGGSGGSGIDHKAFAKRLWGDLYFNRETRKFQRTAPHSGVQRSFVEFVLEPLWKLYAQTLGEEPDVLSRTLQSLGIRLKKAELHLDPAPLIKLVMRSFLGSPAGLVEALVSHLPSPVEAAAIKTAHIYTGSGALGGSGGGSSNVVATAMRACDPNGPLMVNVVKLVDTPDASSFLAFGRVLSGTVKAGQQVKVLGENFSLGADEEDMAVRTVSAIAIGQARYRIDVSSAPAGSLVLLEGVDDVIAKTATITGVGKADKETTGHGHDHDYDELDISIFRPLAFSTVSVVNLSVEPLNPSELPKVLAGLRKITKAYPLALTRVEESGEHVIIGTGELALDSIMHDLRKLYAEVEIKVADPVTSFSETVVDTSSVKCFGLTPNKKNKLAMIAEPLDKGLGEDIESGKLTPESLMSSSSSSSSDPKRRMADFLQDKYGWDLLAARNVWGFGPSADRGPNILIDDTLAGDVDKQALRAIKDSVLQGFQWGCREGPLCDEPIRNVKWRLLDATVAGEPIHRGGGQVIPTARRVGYSAFLLASPRMMEPVYSTEILAPADAIQSIYNVLARRRGHITSDAPKAGTPFYVVKGFLPVMDSFGFETDLRVHTQGQAFGMQVFDHWALVPGDPLDKSILLRPLEPSPPHALGREFMVKTRRRKGLPEDVSISRFFDPEMIAYLAAQDAAAAGAGSS